jgi:hypothetical protein
VNRNADRWNASGNASLAQSFLHRFNVNPTDLRGACQRDLALSVKLHGQIPA